MSFDGMGCYTLLDIDNKERKRKKPKKTTTRSSTSTHLWKPLQFRKQTTYLLDSTCQDIWPSYHSPTRASANSYNIFGFCGQRSPSKERSFSLKPHGHRCSSSTQSPSEVSSHFASRTQMAKSPKTLQLPSLFYQ